MRKTIVFLIFTIGVLQSTAQRNEKAPKSKIYYQQKSNKQNTAGWVFLVGGSLLTAIGINAATSKTDDSPDVLLDATAFVGTLAAVAGAGFAIGGITLLSSSRKNAKKAAEISFNNQKNLMPTNNAFALKMQPTVSLRIPLGKN